MPNNAYSREKINTNLFNKFQSLQAHLKATTKESKQNNFSRLSNKLLYSKTSPTSYWFILKTLLKNKKDTLYATSVVQGEIYHGL